jgi:hypothetical protein
MTAKAVAYWVTTGVPVFSLTAGGVVCHDGVARSCRKPFQRGHRLSLKRGTTWSPSVRSSEAPRGHRLSLKRGTTSAIKSLSVS